VQHQLSDHTTGPEAQGDTRLPLPAAQWVAAAELAAIRRNAASSSSGGFVDGDDRPSAQRIRSAHGEL
jgi:hypothetical protein